MLPGGYFRLCLLGGPPQLVLRALLAQMARLLQVAPLAHVGRCLHFFHEILDPLEHSVLDHAGPAGWHVAVGPFRTLSSSDCHPAGPAGPYVAGGPCWLR